MIMEANTSTKTSTDDISDVELLEFLVNYSSSGPSSTVQDPIPMPSQEDFMRKDKVLLNLETCPRSSRISRPPARRCHKRKSEEDDHQLILEHWEPGEIVEDYPEDCSSSSISGDSPSKDSSFASSVGERRMSSDSGIGSCFDSSRQEDYHPPTGKRQRLEVNKHIISVLPIKQAK